MKHVLTADEMRWCDETAIQKAGIPGLLLMENAGRSVVDVLVENYPQLREQHVVVFCGKGNNGGDGFVIARLLSQYAASITVIVLSASTDIKHDAKTNYDILKKLTPGFVKNISIKKYSPGTAASLKNVHIIVDAIFGTGFTGAAKKPFSDVIEWINASPSEVISIDIPSGIDGTTGCAGGAAVKADRTITFSTLKTGLLCNQGRINSGQVSVTDIGIPQSITHDQRFHVKLVERADSKKALPARSVFANKYTTGKVFVLAGSKGLTGAAALACSSALRTGAGAVILGTPEPVYAILAKKLTEVMVKPLPATSDGTLSTPAFDAILEKIAWADVAVIGPGLGQNQETHELIIKILLHTKGKIVLDADGLNAVASIGASKLRSMRAELILTPHTGEFSRLINIPAKDIEADRIRKAEEFAKRNPVTLVLKGVPTVTAAHSRGVVLNSTGNPGMATVGSGDVLTGIISGLWAQGMDTFESAYSGVYVHGLSGDCAAKQLGEKSIVAQDLIDYLPTAIRAVET